MILLKLQPQIEAELQSGHFGSSHMRALTRSYVRWPNIDDELEVEAATCNICQLHAHYPLRTAVHSRLWLHSPGYVYMSLSLWTTMSSISPCQERLVLLSV
jgi:hypothetical protein